MTHVVFFEKPGCINNTRQKKWLQAAGHHVEAHNLLTHPWTREELLLFLEPFPVAAWFNRSAPDIKSGKIDIERLDPDSALELLQKQPLLIRRPLIHADGRRFVGFDIAIVQQFIGLPDEVISQQTSNDAEACLRHPAGP